MEYNNYQIEMMIKTNELEKLFIHDMDMSQDGATLLAKNIIMKKDKIMEILQAEYEIEVTRK